MSKKNQKILSLAKTLTLVDIVVVVLILIILVFLVMSLHSPSKEQSFELDSYEIYLNNLTEIPQYYTSDGLNFSFQTNNLADSTQNLRTNISIIGYKNHDKEIKLDELISYVIKYDVLREDKMINNQTKEYVIEALNSYKKHIKGENITKKLFDLRDAILFIRNNPKLNKVNKTNSKQRESATIETLFELIKKYQQSSELFYSESFTNILDAHKQLIIKKLLFVNKTYDKIKVMIVVTNGKYNQEIHFWSYYKKSIIKYDKLGIGVSDCLVKSYTIQKPKQSISIIAKENHIQKWPVLDIFVDGKQISNITINSKNWTTYVVNITDLTFKKGVVSFDLRFKDEYHYYNKTLNQTLYQTIYLKNILFDSKDFNGKGILDYGTNIDAFNCNEIYPMTNSIFKNGALRYKLNVE